MVILGYSIKLGIRNIMNVIFHIIASIGVFVLVTDTEKIKPGSPVNKTLLAGLFAFLAGIISHGILDIVPHCYPVNSEIDVVASLIAMSIFLKITHPTYRPILLLSFTGCLLPDIIDLGPAIMNKYFRLNLWARNKFFPWHWSQYSGSIHTHDCSISILNHILLVAVIIIICWVRRIDFKRVFLPRN